MVGGIMLMQLSINYRIGLRLEHRLPVGGDALWHLSRSRTVRHDWLQQLYLINYANQSKFLQNFSASSFLCKKKLAEFLCKSCRILLFYVIVNG